MTPEQDKKIEAMVKAMVEKGMDKVKAIKIAKSKVLGNAKKEDWEPFLKWNAEIDELGLTQIKEGNTVREGFKIGGTALIATTSRNGNTYTVHEIGKQDGKTVKIFLDHDISADNAVGKAHFTVENDRLRYTAELHNTHKHPDVKDLVDKGLIDSVSIGADGDLVKTKEGAEVTNLDIKELSFVGLSGVQGAGIDWAIQEKLKLIPQEEAYEEEKDKKEKMETKIKEQEESKEETKPKEEKTEEAKEEVKTEEVVKKEVPAKEESSEAEKELEAAKEEAVEKTSEALKKAGEEANVAELKKLSLKEIYHIRDLAVKLQNKPKAKGIVESKEELKETFPEGTKSELKRDQFGGYFREMDYDYWRNHSSNTPGVNARWTRKMSIKA